MGDAAESARLPTREAVTLGDGPCPRCGAEQFVVDGVNVRASADDRAFVWDAIATCCKQRVGELREEVDTIFGAREDLDVLRFSRGRVYG